MFAYVPIFLCGSNLYYQNIQINKYEANLYYFSIIGITCRQAGFPQQQTAMDKLTAHAFRLKPGEPKTN